MSFIELYVGCSGALSFRCARSPWLDHLEWLSNAKVFGIHGTSEDCCSPPGSNLHTVALRSLNLPSTAPVLGEPFTKSFAAVGFCSTALFVVERYCVEIRSSIKLKAL